MSAAALRPQLAGAISAFVEGFVRPAAPAMARGQGPGADVILEQAAAHGLAGLLIPRAYGGAGGSHTDFVAYVEAVAQECASTSVILDVHGSVGTEPIVRFADEAQKHELLPRLASGEWLAGFCLTEPGSGSDAAAMTTRAVREGAGYRLSGTKSFITNSGVAHLYTVYARTGEDCRQISAFLVEAANPGLSTGRPLHKLGLRGARTGEVFLDGTPVAAERRLGEEGQGFAIAMAALDSGRIGIAAQAVGIAKGALDIAIAQRRGDGDVDTSALADMAAGVVAARALTVHAARLVDAGLPATHAASVAKLIATDTCVAVTQAAVDLCAPDSSADAHPAAVRWRDAKATQIYEGTNQVQRIVIARGLLR